MIGLLKADARFIPLKDKAVQMICCSPPYWSLRDYGLPPMVWDGKEGCEHIFNEYDAKLLHENRQNLDGGTIGNTEYREKLHGWQKSKAGFCRKCGAWLGCLGLEPQPELYIAHLVSIFREVRRVLRDDGTVWLNMGDSYAGSGCGSCDYRPEGSSISKSNNKYKGQKPSVVTGLKPKDLCNIPHRLASALQRDGWWWRSTVVWNKPNPMPESVSGWRWERHRVKVKNRGKSKAGIDKQEILGAGNPHALRDGYEAEYQNCPGCPKCNPNNGLILRKGSWRPTSSHEYIFMLAKSDTYFCDGDAVREPITSTGGACFGKQNISVEGTGAQSRKLKSPEERNHPAGRNLRDVWTIPENMCEIIVNGKDGNIFKASVPESEMIKCFERWFGNSEEMKDVWKISTKSFSGAHFSTFPPDIVIPCIRAGTSEMGCCPKCGSAWVRVVERNILESLKDHPYQGEGQLRSNQTPGGQGTDHSTLGGQQHKIERKEMGWRPTCDCGSKETVPCIVLDPFGGSGTVAETAKKMGRSAIHLDLTYFPLAKERIWPG